MKNTKFKFKVGNVIKHKASGEKFVILKVKLEERMTTLYGICEEPDRYKCNNIANDELYTYFSKEWAEIVFELVK